MPAQGSAACVGSYWAMGELTSLNFWTQAAIFLSLSSIANSMLPFLYLNYFARQACFFASTVERILPINCWPFRGIVEIPAWSTSGSLRRACCQRHRRLAQAIGGRKFRRYEVRFRDSSVLRTYLLSNNDGALQLRRNPPRPAASIADMIQVDGTQRREEGRAHLNVR